MVKSAFCSQDDKDTFQSQAHVPQAEISFEPKAQIDIVSGESIQNLHDKEAQAKKVVENAFCLQADQDSSQSQAHVPQDEKSSKPRDQEGQVEKKSNNSDKDTVILSLIPQQVPQSTIPPQEATPPLP